MKTSDIPSEWLAVLARVRRFCPFAIIAGGALRDLDHGLQPKDLDIFVETPEAFRCLPEADLTSETEFTAYAEWDSTVLSAVTYRMENPNIPPVNLIGLAPGECRIVTQLQRFDFGLCRIATNGFAVVVSNDYRQDKAKRAFTLMRSVNVTQFERSLQRFERFQERYPDHLLDTSRFPKLQAEHEDGFLF